MDGLSKNENILKHIQNKTKHKVLINTEVTNIENPTQNKFKKKKTQYIDRIIKHKVILNIKHTIPQY